MKEKLLKALQLIDQLERKCRNSEVREDESFAEIKTLLGEIMLEYKEPTELPYLTYPVNPCTPCMPGPGYPPPPIMAEGPTNQEQDQKASKWGGWVSLFPWVLPHYEPPKDSGYTPWYTYVGPQSTDDHNQYVGGPAGKESEG